MMSDLNYGTFGHILYHCLPHCATTVTTFSIHLIVEADLDSVYGEEKLLFVTIPFVGW
jgi:hypothetical protein